MSDLRGIRWMVQRSLRQHALSTTVTALSVALACGLLMAVFVIRAQTYTAFTSGGGGFDAVLGARGSQLQLILNSIYHLETSTGNLPWRVFAEIREHPLVEQAWPLAVGDNYRGYRIVGCDPAMFTEHEFAPGKKFALQGGGRLLDASRRESVIGSFVARKTGLKVGDAFNTYHGLKDDPAARHDEQFVVVGILQPTNTPADRALWIPIEGYFRMAGHALYGSGDKYVAQPGVAIPDENKEISAALLTFRNSQAGFSLSQTINKQGKTATLAWPIAKVMSDLFEKMGWMERVLALVAYLVVVVAAASILAGVYNSMNERRREFAILRSLGARRGTLFAAIVAEAAAIALLGTLASYAVYALLLGVATLIIREQTGVVLDLLAYHPVLLLTPLGMTILGGLAGVAPAIKAYATDVATNLAPTS